MDQEYFGTRRTTVEPKCSLSHYTELSAEPFVPKGRKSKNVCLRRQNSRTLPRITRADPGARRCVRVARGGAATSGATACRSTYAARRVTRRVRRTELYTGASRDSQKLVVLLCVSLSHVNTVCHSTRRAALAVVHSRTPARHKPLLRADSPVRGIPVAAGFDSRCTLL